MATNQDEPSVSSSGSCAQAEHLRKLMEKWARLEEWRCHGPFVRIYSDDEHGMHCVDEYTDATVRGRWDRQKIVMSVRAACEERGWELSIRDFPEDKHSSRRNTRASVSRYTGETDFQDQPAKESRHGDSECRAAAVLEAYVNMLEA